MLQNTGVFLCFERAPPLDTLKTMTGIAFLKHVFKNAMPVMVLSAHRFWPEVTPLHQPSTKSARTPTEQALFGE